MSANGASPKTKTFKEQLKQLLNICIEKEQFHKGSPDGILAFKKKYHLSHFNNLPTKYPTVTNIDETARAMHMYELSLSSLVVLNFSFNTLLKDLDECNKETLDTLLESENLFTLSTSILRGFILKRIQQHLTPYKINLERELKEASSLRQSQLANAAITEIQSSKSQIPSKILQIICKGLQRLEGSVLDRISSTLDFPDILSANTTAYDETMPILNIFKAELAKIEFIINATVPEIKESQKEFKLIAGFIESLFSLLYNIGEFNNYHQQLEELKLRLPVPSAQDVTEPLSFELSKLSLAKEDSSPDSWDSFEGLDLSKLKSAPIDDLTADWGLSDLSRSGTPPLTSPTPSLTPYLDVQLAASSSLIPSITITFTNDDEESASKIQSREQMKPPT